MFLKSKDIFTIATILCGFLSFVLAAEGNIIMASFVILSGFVFDKLDGFFANITNTKNKFGAEFDCVADLILYSMAPGILVFFVFRQYSIILATVAGISPLLSGCIRLARFNVKRIEYPGFWMGFPRPASALAIVGLVNSNIFSAYEPYVVGAVFVISLSAMNLTIIPYPGHHKRKFTKSQKISLLTIFSLVALALMIGLLWDALLLSSFMYLISPLFAIPVDEKKKINEFIDKWREE